MRSALEARVFRARPREASILIRGSAAMILIILRCVVSLVNASKPSVLMERSVLLALTALMLFAFLAVERILTVTAMF